MRWFGKTDFAGVITGKTDSAGVITGKTDVADVLTDLVMGVTVVPWIKFGVPRDVVLVL